MKLRTALYGIGGLALSGMLAIAAYNTLEERRYIRDHTFTDTVTVKADRLSPNWDKGIYRVLAEDGRLIKKTGVLETMQDLEILIEKGTKVEFTGYPKKDNPNNIIAFEIKPITK